MAATDGEVKDLGPLETSPQDDRSYRAIELPNGLQALLVHDKETEKAAAALDVNVGSLFDGDVEGLAHFCEHMLFLGTEKYPDEQAYSKYLNQNGGGSNAYTDTNDTVYFFNVNHDKLEGSLDRFAQFFVAPLFTASATEREMKAVDSENNKNLQSDPWRLHQIHCGAAKAGHPLRQFRCGSLKTLLDDPKARGVDVRDKLLHFHDTYYSSNIMRLVVLGREDLDALQAMVVEKFSAVKNLAIPPPTVNDVPYGPEQLGRWLEVVPVMDLRMLQLFWPLPPQRQHYAQAPTRYISHLLGHEGEGSVLSYLKAKGWANELSAGPQFDNREWASMDVSIELTDAGVQHVEEVVKAVYAYLHVIRSAGPQRYVFEELAQTAANGFRFLSKQQPIAYASALATRMQKYPPPHFISGPHLVREYDPALLQATLDLLTPERMVVMAVAKAYEGQTALTEPWYGTAYNERAIPPAFLATLSASSPEELVGDEASARQLHLPRPNDFIPSDFDLVTPALANTKVPVLLREEAGDGEGGAGARRLWFKHDGVFKQPKLLFQALIVTPVLSESPEACVLGEMLARLVTDKLAEFSYNAALAGLHYSLSAQTLQSSLTVAVQGYSHKLPVLARTILQALASYTAGAEDDALFVRLQDRLAKDYANDLLSQPYQLAMAESNLLLVAPYSTRDKLAAAKAITPARLRAFLPRLLESFRLEALVYGNNTEAQALDLFAMTEEILKPRPLPPSVSGALGWRVVRLEADEEVEHRVAAENKEEPNHGIQVLYQLGEQAVALSAKLDLLVLLLKDEAFDQLRTKQQLGYVVFCSAAGANRHVLSLSFLVQTTHAPEVVLGAVEAFLVYVRGYLETLSEEEYATNVSALVEAKLEKAKNYAEQGNRYFNEIGKGSYLFDRAEREAEAIKGISKAELLAFFDEHISASAPGRRKLAVVVHGASHPLPPPSIDEAEAEAEAGAGHTDGNGDGNGAERNKQKKRLVRVADVAAFKRARALFPLRPQPALRAVAVPGMQPPRATAATD